jgi:hypothetical protein
MPKFIVSYSEHSLREIAVTAETAEEAERMVLEGDLDVDCGASELQDAEVVSVNNVREI